MIEAPKKVWAIMDTRHSNEVSTEIWKNWEYESEQDAHEQCASLNRAFHARIWGPSYVVVCLETPEESKT